MSNLQKIKKAADELRLSPRERSLLRAQIFGVPTLKNEPARPVSSFSFSVSRITISFAAVVLVLLGSTTAYAESSLPGDFLYILKTQINEPVIGTLVFSSEAKANYHAALAERRMEEAEALAAENRLDARAAETLERGLTKHVADAQGKVEDLTKENADVAAEVSIRFAASLSTHGDILERLGDGSEDEDTQEYSGRLAYYAKSNVEDRAREESEDEDKSTGGESMSVEFTLKATTSEEAELDATRISGATIPLVSTEVSSTHAATASPISTVSTTSTTSAEEVEEEHIRSIEEEVRYEVLLKASKKYNRDFLKELWRSQDGKDEDEDGEGRGEVRGWRGNRDSRD